MGQLRLIDNAYGPAVCLHPDGAVRNACNLHGVAPYLAAMIAAAELSEGIEPSSLPTNVPRLEYSPHYPFLLPLLNGPSLELLGNFRAWPKSALNDDWLRF